MNYELPDDPNLDAAPHQRARKFEAKRSEPTKRKEPLRSFSGELPAELLEELERFKQLSGILKHEMFREALTDYLQKKKDARRCVQCGLFKKKGAYLCAKCDKLLHNRVNLEEVSLLVKEL